DARYVAAVVNAGGMGFITCMSFPDDVAAFRREVRLCRDLTGGRPFGVSLAISRRLGNNDRLRPYLDVIVDEKVRFVETSGDTPEPILPRLKDAGCVVMHKVPAVRYAQSVERLPVDAIAVISGEAGGHPGLFMVGQIVQGVLAADAVTKPLALGGGMGTGRHLASALAMGAGAMLMGSRMVVAEEIWAHRRYKELVTAIDESANRLVMRTFRNNHRVLDNAAAREVERLESQGVTDFARYEPWVAGRYARQAYATGDVSQGMIDMGPAGVFAREIKPVAAIFDEILDDAAATIRRLSATMVAG
ncbi:MAG TPA: nitronate monooxygenase, partial [Vineibacter sp.]|nr:nitronate monooxygenase [Vineibacter sp.]